MGNVITTTTTGDEDRPSYTQLYNENQAARTNMPSLEDAIKLGDEIVLVNQNTNDDTYKYGTALGVWGSSHSSIDAMTHVHGLNPAKFPAGGFNSSTTSTHMAKFKKVGSEYEFTDPADYNEAAPATTPQPRRPRPTS